MSLTVLVFLQTSLYMRTSGQLQVSICACKVLDVRQARTWNSSDSKGASDHRTDLSLRIYLLMANIFYSCPCVLFCSVSCLFARVKFSRPKRTTKWFKYQYLAVSCGPSCVVPCKQSGASIIHPPFLFGGSLALSLSLSLVVFLGQ